MTPERSFFCALAIYAMILMGADRGSLFAQVSDPPAPVPAPAPAAAQSEEERARIEADANAQAAEADRLYAVKSFAEAIPFYEAERISRGKIGDLRYEAHATRAIGLCDAELGSFAEAIEAFEQARKIDSQRGDIGMQGCDHFLIAKVELLRDRPLAAIKALGPGLELLVKGGDKDHESEARIIKAKALISLDKLAQARVELERACDLAGIIDDPLRRAEAWLELGDLALVMSEPGEAFDYLLDSRSVFLEKGKAAEVARIDRLLGDDLIALGLADLAQSRVRMAAGAHEKLQDYPALADDLRFLTLLAIESENLTDAHKLVIRRVDAERESNNTSSLIDAFMLEAEIERLAKHLDLAKKTLENALAIARREKLTPRLIGGVLLELIAVEHERMDDAQAKILLGEAEKLAKASGEKGLLAELAELRKLLEAEPEILK